MAVVHATCIPRLPRRQARRRELTNAGLIAEHPRPRRPPRAPARRPLRGPLRHRPTSSTRYYIPGNDDPVGHPNAAGYDLLAQIFFDVIRDVDTVPPVPGLVTPANGAKEVSADRADRGRRLGLRRRHRPRRRPCWSTTARSRAPRRRGDDQKLDPDLRAAGSRSPASSACGLRVARPRHARANTVDREVAQLHRRRHHLPRRRHRPRRPGGRRRPPRASPAASAPAAATPAIRPRPTSTTTTGRWTARTWRCWLATSAGSSF